MSLSARIVYRLVAAMLMAWLVGSAVAAPLTVCCTGDEPCCVAPPSGHGCMGCAAAPALPAQSPGRSAAPPAHLQPQAETSGKASVSFQPWKPPD